VNEGNVKMLREILTSNVALFALITRGSCCFSRAHTCVAARHVEMFSKNALFVERTSTIACGFTRRETRRYVVSSSWCGLRGLRTACVVHKQDQLSPTTRTSIYRPTRPTTALWCVPFGQSWRREVCPTRCERRDRCRKRMHLYAHIYLIWKNMHFIALEST
jgi:hypothetical protein